MVRWWVWLFGEGRENVHDDPRSFASQAAPLFDEGIQKLVQRYDKCLNNDGNYVEK